MGLEGPSAGKMLPGFSASFSSAKGRAKILKYKLLKCKVNATSESTSFWGAFCRLKQNTVTRTKTILSSFRI